MPEQPIPDVRKSVTVAASAEQCFRAFTERLSEWWPPSHVLVKKERAGLAFEPLPSQDLPDVAGILWIDPGERMLRHLEYTWINPPPEARAPALGGRADFVRLADGGWIIQRWNIRMPRPSDAPGTGYGGYTDQGGEVLAVGARQPRRR